MSGETATSECDLSPASRLQAWITASKPASWSKLLVPLVLGQVAGFCAGGVWHVGALLFGALFCFFDLLFIVFLNDWADQEVDALKRKMFPDHCSPKTIPDNLLPASHLIWAGMAAGCVAVLLSVVAAFSLGRPLLTVAGPLALVAFFSYSLPPLALNYRGGGELVEAAGVGLLFPWIHAYAQSGLQTHPGYLFFVGFFLLSLSSALASGLSDEESDRAGGKCTVATVWGNSVTRRLIEVCVWAAGPSWLLTGFVVPQVLPAWLAAIPAMVLVWHGIALRRVSRAAVTNAFAAQRIYKRSLHQAMVRGTLVLSILILGYQLIWN